MNAQKSLAMPLILIWREEKELTKEEIQEVILYIREQPKLFHVKKEA